MHDWEHILKWIPSVMQHKNFIFIFSVIQPKYPSLSHHKIGAKPYSHSLFVYMRTWGSGKLSIEIIWRYIFSLDFSMIIYELIQSTRGLITCKKIESLFRSFWLESDSIPFLHFSTVSWSVQTNRICHCSLLSLFLLIHQSVCPPIHLCVYLLVYYTLFCFRSFVDLLLHFPRREYDGRSTPHDGLGSLHGREENRQLWSQISKCHKTI